jgi:alpha-D-ribose 1-methylphosphonate 5-triphosphate diphosphatase PhnM
MNSFLKISSGFILGVVCTIGIIYIIAAMQDTEENRLREEIRIKTLRNIYQSFGESDTYEDEHRIIQSFELSTNKGIVVLHTYMSKDSVKILMGRPQSTDIIDYGYNDEVHETWKYKGSNKYIDEFTIEFINSKLSSVRQFKE